MSSGSPGWISFGVPDECVEIEASLRTARFRHQLRKDRSLVKFTIARWLRDCERRWPRISPLLSLWSNQVVNSENRQVRRKVFFHLSCCYFFLFVLPTLKSSGGFPNVLEGRHASYCLLAPPGKEKVKQGSRIPIWSRDKSQRIAQAGFPAFPNGTHSVGLWLGRFASFVRNYGYMYVLLEFIPPPR